MADEFHVDDLMGLWRTGAVLMPEVGRQFALAAISLNDAGEGASLFQTSQGPSPLSGPWNLLRETVQGRVLGATAERCVRAGSALTKIADAYATTDYYSRADLEQYVDDKAEIRAGGNGTFQVPEVPVIPT
ncbi:hypothetical protein [Phytomonospora endophytica]|uniref:Uncharacterized protein n=1 Tax=Phytomonospora endophytica TaxID=714109 RepID=A0A841FUV0_9ACTN|nr:hypothetical protein [Phytomonospora endophytica]MBB6036289.1 hypothetical protein [Phytomonospora endophytica]